MTFRFCIVQLALLATGLFTAARAAAEPAPALTLENGVISSTFTQEGGALRLTRLQSLQAGKEVLAWDDANLFTVHLAGGNKPVCASTMKLAAAPRIVALAGDAKAARLSERLAGKALCATFEDAESGLSVEWRAVLRDGSHYLRQEIAVTTARPVAVADIEMIRTALPVGAKLAGYTDGAPVVCGNWFLGMEHPMAQTAVSTGGGWEPLAVQRRTLSRQLANLKPGPLPIEFRYTRGNHRLDVLKAELVAGGKVVSVDAHAGFAGKPSSANHYTLTVPEGIAGAELRVTLGGIAGQSNSYGDIVLGNGEINGTVTMTAALPRQFTLEPGNTWRLSTGIGIAPAAGQLRRAFAQYLDRERAHPYRQYWHYNSWYDLNIDRNDNPDPLKRMNEAQCLEVVNAFQTELFEKRGVGLDGFLWDDGWDDWNSLWQFHKGFPNGFAKMSELAKKQGATQGAWLSPWGGYGQSHNMRVKLGKEQGYETNGSGFSLGGPKYYGAFRDSCLNMIRNYSMGCFKFDGIGGGTWATGASTAIAPDLDGLVRLIGDLRKEKSDIFINCTVGTWASPYWLFFADSIWRQGEDTSFTGKGNGRERWINYKDSIVHDRFASRSPLFPVNSLMYHGVCLGPRANPGRMPPPAQDLASFKHEVRMAVGYSSTLGELYITPALMTPEAWDILAEGLAYARARKEIMFDAHWIGGNPGKQEIYGIAAWHPVQGGVLTLRNPDDKAQTIEIKLADAFELPAGAPAQFTLRSPWKADAAQAPIPATADKPVAITLQPFEVLTFEAQAAK